MEPEEFDFKITRDDYETIINALVEKPFKQVNMTIHRLHNQMTKNLEEREKPAE
jgi:hypothetical protein